MFGLWPVVNLIITGSSGKELSTHLSDCLNSSLSGTTWVSFCSSVGVTLGSTVTWTCSQLTPYHERARFFLKGGGEIYPVTVSYLFLVGGGEMDCLQDLLFYDT